MAAYTLSRNLRLRLEQGLSANSRYNLERIDLLGSTLSIDTTEATRLRSRVALYFEPNSSALGGSGDGGDVYFGTVGNPLDNVFINSTNVSFGTLGDVLTASNTKTVTNKTLDFNQNTFLNFPGASGLDGYTTTWIQADGLVKTVTHNLNSLAVIASVIDLLDNDVILVDIIDITGLNTIVLTASEIPSVSGYRIVVTAV